MGIMTGMGRTGITEITFYNAEGKATGSMSMTKAAKKKPKRLQYNIKEISVQIMRAKTSGNARTVASKARSKAALLRQKLLTEEYDSGELKSALAHALKMEKIAKKRMKHLQQEEQIKQKGSSPYLDTEEMEEASAPDENINMQQELTLKEEDLKKLIQEYEKLMQETLKETEKLLEGDDLLNEIMEAAPEKMSPEDLELLKKKHRAKELKEIMEADLEYLKAMFDRLAKEKQEISSGSHNSGISNTGNSGVALELDGMEIPVPAMEAAPAMESCNLDIMA